MMSRARLPVRYSHRLRFSACGWPHARLHDQCHSFALYLPTRFIWQSAVWQRGLAPSGVEKTDAVFFIAEILCGGLDDHTVEIR